MPLTGLAKKNYQRSYMKEYMRVLRSKGRLLRPIVKTSQLDAGPYQGNNGGANIPMLDADGNAIPEY